MESTILLTVRRLAPIPQEEKNSDANWLKPPIHTIKRDSSMPNDVIKVPCHLSVTHIEANI